MTSCPNDKTLGQEFGDTTIHQCQDSYYANISSRHYLLETSTLGLHRSYNLKVQSASCSPALCQPLPGDKSSMAQHCMAYYFEKGFRSLSKS